MKSYGKLIGVVVAAWFVVVVAASVQHVFVNTAGRLGVAVAIGASVPLAVFGLWVGLSKEFRQYLLALNPATLTFIQSQRVAGFMFLVLASYNILPALFAWTAGLGDIAVGATAAYAAIRLANPGARNRFIRWQFFGIADLVTAVSLGVSFGFLNPHNTQMAPMTVLPMSLVPVFLVPLFLMLHIICIMQARRWNAGSRPQPASLQSAFAR